MNRFISSKPWVAYVLILLAFSLGAVLTAVIADSTERQSSARACLVNEIE